MFGKKKKVSPVILSQGLNIEVVRCSMDDFKFVCMSSGVSGAILKIAEAIRAVRWFKGKWHIEEDGRMIYGEHDGVDFRKVKLSPVVPDSNIVALGAFHGIQTGEIKPPIDVGLIASLNYQRIMVDEDGSFYIFEVREEYNAVQKALL